MNANPKFLLRNQIPALIVAAAIQLVSADQPARGTAPSPASKSKSKSEYQVVHGWPVLPEGAMLGHVSGIAVDSHDHVFVFHRGKHSILGTNYMSPAAESLILCFEGKSGKQIAAWGANTFFSPHGLRVDSHDNVWITDVSRHQVLKFTHDGQLLLEVGEKGVPGWDERHFNKPTDIAFAPDGSFYVSDGYGNSRVAKFSSSGKFEFEWGKKGSQPGEFNLPHGIARDSNGRIYVADRSNSRIQVFDPNGTFLQQWKSQELGRPWAITFGPDGFLYVADGGDMNPWPPDRGHLLKLNLDGKVLSKWASFGNYDGQLCWAHDIAVGRDGAVYTGDILGRRAQKFIKK